MEITDEMARKALEKFREVQHILTPPWKEYTGCYCDGCVQSMKAALQEIIKKED